jgi:SAM-dependent methyltransferase
MHKAIVLKSAVKAALPFQPWLRQLKRRVLPYQDTLGNIEFTLQQGLQIIQSLRQAGTEPGGDVLELGSGWLPIIPLLFHLAGARRIILTDVERLMDRRTIAKAQQLILQNLPMVAAALDFTEAELAARISKDFAPEYLVPWNSRQHPRHSVDIIFSRTVLEHVHSSILEQLLADFDRILRPGGSMCHVIDNSDHWQHQDTALSRLDFLRYEDTWYWKLACFNPQFYQNRLRHSDYLSLFRGHGWSAILADGVPDERCLRDLTTLPLAAAFQNRDPRDLAILTSTFVLRRSAELAAPIRPEPAG